MSLTAAFCEICDMYKKGAVTAQEMDEVRSYFQAYHGCLLRALDCVACCGHWEGQDPSQVEVDILEERLEELKAQRQGVARVMQTVLLVGGLR
jgi:hypothetical protein